MNCADRPILARVHARTARLARPARAQRPRSGPAACTRLFFFQLSLTGPVAKTGPRSSSARAPRVPGRNLGLGRDLAAPPGLKQARCGAGGSHPSIKIQRLGAKNGRIKTPWPPATLTLKPLFPTSSSLFARRRPGAAAGTAAAMEATGERAAAERIRPLPSLSFLSLPLLFSFATPQQEQQGPQRLHAAARHPAMVAGDEGWRRRRSALAGVRVPVRG